MKNNLYFDADFNFLLLECEENNSNSIYLVFHTSEAASQELEISINGGTGITKALPSDADINFDLSQEYWADNGETTIIARNAEGLEATITILFRGIAPGSVAVNYVDDTTFEVAQQQNESASGEAGGAGFGNDFDFVETIRNIGYRLLNEPTNVTAFFDSIAEEVKITWTDPADIITNEPTTATWAGTVVVRKEGSAPLHRWDGTLIVESTTRDEYAETALVDDTIDIEKQYYYGIFPYDTRGWYRYTKIVSARALTMPIPDITSLTVDGGDVTINYSVPVEYTWSQVGVVYKKNAAPADRTDGRTVEIAPETGSTVIHGLSGNSVYYFRIYSTEATTGKQYICDARAAETGDLPIEYVIYDLFISAYQT